MQGHKSSLSNHGLSSGDADLDSQSPWNNIQTETNIQYLHHVSLGETSSGSGQSQQNGRKREHLWNMQSRASLNLEEPPSILTLDNVEVNADNNRIANGVQISGSNGLPQDLNMRSGYGYNEDDGREDVVGFSLDGPRISRKRKAIEENVGQSSGTGESSNFYNHSERSRWHAIPGPPSQVAPATENGLVGPSQENPARGPTESVRRNFRLRINGAHQQDHLPSPDPFLVEAEVGNSSDISSSRHSSGLLLRSLDLNPSPAVENGSSNGQSISLNVPSTRRNHQSRWNRMSSSRTRNSSTSATLYEEPLTRNIPRGISEHPMFVPASEIGSSSQQNYNLVGENNSISGNIASSSRAGSRPGPNSSSPTRANRSYPRRLSEIIRRSLLSSAGQSRNHGVRLNSSHESGVNGQTRSNSRAALLEAHIDRAIPIPYTLAAGGEGRSSIMSEIRHVLDLMRRGEGLRFEDVMMLDHSILFGMANTHDRHRDMRLDVDNMSYEELLALGERIGNVCTGLTEETIVSRLKLKKFVVNKTEDHAERELCSICREEYIDGKYVGTLECGHDFHTECIKQWLLQKNLCPICKSTGLTV